MRISLKSVHKKLFIILGVATILFSGCKPTRLLTDDQYLLQKNKIVIDNKKIDKSELEGYYRQKPNKRTLIFFKMSLAAYNFSKLGKERKWKKWVGRVIGEEPSIYDSTLVDRTRLQFERYLKNHAYYNSVVYDSTILKRRRAKVIYQIEANEPITIDEISYKVNDSVIAPLIFQNVENSKLGKGDLFTLETLQNERTRITNELRDSGFFYFDEDYITFSVDTVNDLANIQIVVDKATVFDSENIGHKVNHKKYWINNVFVYPDFDPQNAIRNKLQYFGSFDTTSYNGFNVIFPGEPNIKPKVVLKANGIYPGEMFRNSNVKSTTKYLNSLRLFRLSNINFAPVFDSDSLINCNIQLTPATYQNFSINFETTNTQGNYGLGGYLNYQHKNLFKGAEILNIKVSGLFQRQNKTEETEAVNIFEYGVVTSLETPSFILPFKMERFYKKYNPKTSFSLVYNTQQKPQYYNRDIYGISMGYVWHTSKNIKHIVRPFDFSAVTIPYTSQRFDSIIDGKYIENSFKDYFIAGGNYSFIYQDKGKNNKYSNTYVRWNVGLAGNMLYNIHKNILKQETAEGGYYKLLNLQYAHYGLTDIDLRHYSYINRDNLFATRLFAGLAFPIPDGNATAVPFVKQYHAGGAQDIRAWHMYSLGPGTYSISDTLQDQTADIKLEVNLEFRFSLLRSWKGAFFVDAGNIWSISDEDDRPGAFFKIDEFYKQIAVGTGFGLRYDLKFAVIRLDWGIKVKDPSITGPKSWELFNTPFEFKNDINWHFAIGYPF